MKKISNLKFSKRYPLYTYNEYLYKYLEVNIEGKRVTLMAEL